MTIPDLPSFMPGDRVIAFDHRRFIDDRTTPSAQTRCPATILSRYGTTCDYGTGGPVKYPDLCDLEFDHRPGEVSHGHFTDGLTRGALQSCGGA